ncbi:putative quercetinase [Catenaria anguillulae PL171]|uniref:Putative quercetinase n=1 Tax=Catenaria anguillulae PL171 TaxID=765915 RepID=A0A1Y2HJP7_9FUNG|nr:putative quercetinase [Catenaria anguillulae PL171]
MSAHLPEEPSRRVVERVVFGRQQNEGVNVKVWRTVGTVGLPYFDPFVLLDDATVDPPAGFSDHPHRGFMTLSYLLDGEMYHEDFTGNKGHMKPGDVQWMIAGKGIVHAEVPRAPGTHGIQLWINVPSAHKHVEPQYQHLQGSVLPLVSPVAGVSVKVLAGSAFGVEVTCISPTPLLVMDVTLTSNSALDVPVPSAYNVMIYVVSGQVQVGHDAGSKQQVRERDVALIHALDQSASSVVRTAVAEDAAAGARFLFIAGLPLNEPTIHHGPFVLTTYDEIRQAMDDYHECKNGFERAKGFRSKISKLVQKK